ncbi:MAG: 5'-nucleotidase C-terminal domain-containing protein, partial [Lentisphaeria bacterium]|nr:5'-nucleotidase C-terminal domain-containing protein [Lentisphaeria bacterium]
PDPQLYKLLDEHRKKSFIDRKKLVGHVSFPMGGTEDFGKKLGKSLLEFTGADAALCSAPSNYRTRPGKIRKFQVFLLIPYENYISVLTVGPRDMKAILQEQHSLKQKNMFMPLTSRRLKYNKRENKLYLDNREWKNETQKIRVALTSYAASGAGGRYPILREITNRVVREEKNTTLREVFEVWLKRHYSRKKR